MLCLYRFDIEPVIDVQHSWLRARPFLDFSLVLDYLSCVEGFTEVWTTPTEHEAACTILFQVSVFLF